MGLYVLILILPYILFIIYVIRHLLKIKTYYPVTKGATSISVIVACRNEEHRVSPLLKSLSLQDYPSDLLEIIIVDDNSTDNTLIVASSFKESVNLKIVPSKGSGKKDALFTGIGAASGELIMTTDADCRVNEKWVSTTASFYEEFNPALIISPVYLKSMKGLFGKFQELEFLSLQGITAGTAISGNATICNGANLSFSRKEYFKHVKNLRFDIATGDDVFLLHSIKKEKMKILWLESPYSIVETEPARGIKTFFRQRQRWASKGTAYRDLISIFAGIVTFVTIFIQAALLMMSFFDPGSFRLFLVVLAMKSIPDYLLLYNTSKRYGRTELLKWFPVSQLIYPFYVLIVATMTFFPASFLKKKPVVVFR